jgi:hypothetical protein
MPTKESYSSDPLINAIHQGIKRGIDVTVDNECWGSAVILIYSAMDTMAFLGMPADQNDVTRDDFVTWADRYIHFPCKEQISGLEFYGARCATLHTYGSESRISREGRVRQIGYFDHGLPEVRADASISTELVLVSVTALRQSVFTGIDRYLVDLFSDATRRDVAERRLQKIMNAVPRRHP